MRIAICLAACLLIAVFAAPAQAHEAATRACGQIGFTPNSDDGVFRIRAHGVGCAHRAARRARLAPARDHSRHAPLPVRRLLVQGHAGRFEPAERALALHARRGSGHLRPILSAPAGA